MKNTRHSWSIRDGLIIYTCPTFVDENEREIELEDELTPTVTCMVCDEEIASGRTLTYQIERLLESRKEKEREVLRRGITSPAGIDPEKHKPVGWWSRNK